MTADYETCGTCAFYIEVFKGSMGVCPCGYWTLAQEFAGIKPNTPIAESWCNGEGYKKRDA